MEYHNTGLVPGNGGGKQGLEGRKMTKVRDMEPERVESLATIQAYANDQIVQQYLEPRDKVGGGLESVQKVGKTK